MEKEGNLAETRIEMRKREIGDEDSDSDCYKKLDGKPVHEAVDEELQAEEKSPALALLPSKYYEEEINNGENGNKK